MDDASSKVAMPQTPTMSAQITSEHSFRRSSCLPKPCRPIRRSWTAARDAQRSTPSPQRLPYAGTRRLATTVPGPSSWNPNSTTCACPVSPPRFGWRSPVTRMDEETRSRRPPGRALPDGFLRRRREDGVEERWGRLRCGHDSEEDRLRFHEFPDIQIDKFIQF